MRQPALPLGETAREPAQMLEHRPKEPFAQLRRPPFIGVGKIIAARRHRSAHRRERPGVQAQTVADIIEPERMGELREEQRGAWL